jgi:hypothetical protein
MPDGFVAKTAPPGAIYSSMFRERLDNGVLVLSFRYASRRILISWRDDLWQFQRVDAWRT